MSVLPRQVVFSEKLHALADWGSMKAKYVAEGISPAGHLPLLWVGDGPACSEHISLMRRAREDSRHAGKERIPR